MSRASVPSMHCDSEYGCDQWAVDWYELCASTVGNARITSTQRAPGWVSDFFEDFCQEHSCELGQ